MAREYEKVGANISVSVVYKLQNKKAVVIKMSQLCRNEPQNPNAVILKEKFSINRPSSHFPSSSTKNFSFNYPHFSHFLLLYLFFIFID